MLKKGFTLAEVLITLAIIGVVSALTIPALVQDASEAEIEPKLRKAQTAIVQANKTLLYKNGEIVCSNNKQGLIVKCKDGFVRLVEIQPQNSKKMKDTDYLNGKKLEIGLNITNNK